MFSSDVSYSTTSNGNRGRKVTVGIIVVLMVIAMVIGYVATRPRNELSNYTYTNDAGTKFSLLFYNGAKQITATDLKSTSGHGSSKLAFLRAKGPKVADIQPIITINNSASDTLYTEACANHKTFEVQNVQINQKITVCDNQIPSLGQSNFDIAAFSYNGKDYLVLIGLDWDSAKATTDSNYAQQASSNLDLKSYQTSLNSVFASIKPLN